MSVGTIGKIGTIGNHRSTSYRLPIQIPLISDLSVKRGRTTTMNFIRGSAGQQVQSDGYSFIMFNNNEPVFDVSGKGILTEISTTNIFLNSDAPITQTVAVTTANSGVWCLQLWGAGTATTSASTATATGYGVATQDNPNYITVTGNGDVVITIAGADATTKVNFSNRIYPSSWIDTDGSTSTRALTQLYKNATLLLPTPQHSYSIYQEYTPSGVPYSGIFSNRFLWAAYVDVDNYITPCITSNACIIRKRFGGVNNDATAGLVTFTVGTTYKFLTRINTDYTIDLFFLGAKRATHTDTTAFDGDNLFLNGAGATNVIIGNLKNVAIYPWILTDAECIGLVP
jgi:hypothetical protein